MLCSLSVRIAFSLWTTLPEVRTISVMRGILLLGKSTAKRSDVFLTAATVERVSPSPYRERFAPSYTARGGTSIKVQRRTTIARRRRCFNTTLIGQTSCRSPDALTLRKDRFVLSPRVLYFNVDPPHLCIVRVHYSRDFGADNRGLAAPTMDMAQHSAEGRVTPHVLRGSTSESR